MLKNVGDNINKLFAVIFLYTMDIKIQIFNPKLYQIILPSLIIIFWKCLYSAIGPPQPYSAIGPPHPYLDEYIISIIVFFQNIRCSVNRTIRSLSKQSIRCISGKTLSQHCRSELYHKCFIYLLSLIHQNYMPFYCNAI